MNLHGTEVAETIQDDLKNKISKFSRPPGLAVILLGSHPSSLAYVTMKKKASEKIGMHSLLYQLPDHTSEKELVELIQKLNHDPSIDGILVQLPLPSHIKTMHIIETIDPDKDIDGFHPVNLGKLLTGQKDGFIPCTPLGIKVLLEKYKVPTEGKHVVIIGRSTIVGKPLAALLMQNLPGCNATVTVVHSKTADLTSYTKQADILVAAIGKAHFVTADMVKEGVVVVDVGINRVSDPTSTKGYKIVGDVDYEAVSKKASAITPVPKGVGPMTVAMLLQNTYFSRKRRSS